MKNSSRRSARARVGQGRQLGPTETLLIDEFVVNYRRKNIRNLVIRLREDGTVDLSCPLDVSRSQALKFFKSREAWIRIHQEKTGFTADRPVREYKTGETYRLLGKVYRLEVISGGRYSSRLRSDEDVIVLTVPPGKTAVDTEKYMINMSARHLRRLLEELVPRWEELTGLQCSGWSISRMRSRWGVCAPSTGKLRFSICLSQLPVEEIEYVVLHELAHLKHPNHGKGFWDFIFSYMPEAEYIRGRLRNKIDYLPPQSDAEHNM
ncbi:MAG: M48 family metallopeptidase [Mobilibacterium timonense]|uniref:M48 family metallopeptidase n=1 Tax=Mobilibacterium timonense TaxID=1871012 RepID=UPI0023574FEC|nr:SprT family zinc-dependent metalloprotease [Mobilibacterium timonense]MBM6991373.1 M48 family metallopeptidase [Mobilibacterium timonense]